MDPGEREVTVTVTVYYKYNWCYQLAACLRNTLTYFPRVRRVSGRDLKKPNGPVTSGGHHRSHRVIYTRLQLHYPRQGFCLPPRDIAVRDYESDDPHKPFAAVWNGDEEHRHGRLRIEMLLRGDNRCRRSRGITERQACLVRGNDAGGWAHYERAQ